MLQPSQNLASDDTIHGYHQSCPLLEFFPRIDVFFAESWVEECLELNFK